MKILFKNVTRYTAVAYEEFLAFHQKKYHTAYQFYTAFVFFAFLFCITLQLWYGSYALAILFCLFLSVFLLWRLLHPTRQIQKERSSKKITQERKYRFVFYNHHFEIWDKNACYTGRYFQLYKVLDTPNFFYLYQNKNRAFLLDKTGFAVGTAEEFSKFIKKKCWFSYSLEKNAISHTNKKRVKL